MNRRGMFDKLNPLEKSFSLENGANQFSADRALQLRNNISKYKPFSSLVRPDTDDSFSSNVLSFITRSALTNMFFLNGFTISSLKTLCTSSYCGQSFSFGGLKIHYIKTFKRTLYYYLYNKINFFLSKRNNPIFLINKFI